LGEAGIIGFDGIMFISRSPSLGNGRVYPEVP